MDYKPNEGMLLYYEWEDSLDELDDHEYRVMMKALQKYAQTGEISTFSDRTMRAVYKQIIKAIDRNAERYVNKCAKNRENGKKGGAPKGNQNAKKQPNNPNNRTVKKTTETTLPEPYPEPYPDAAVDNNKNILSACAREEAAAASAKIAASPIFDLMPEMCDEIISVWNQQMVTQNINQIPIMSRRANNTRLCFQYVNTFGEYLDVIRAVDQQGWFQKLVKQGRPIKYDWFCNPNNFLKTIEGNYKDDHDGGSMEGLEVIEL